MIEAVKEAIRKLPDAELAKLVRRFDDDDLAGLVREDDQVLSLALTLLVGELAAGKPRVRTPRPAPAAAAKKPLPLVAVSPMGEQQARVLERVKAAGAEGVKLSDVADQVGLSKSTVNYHVKRLVKAGAIRREGNTVNARYFAA